MVAQDGDEILEGYIFSSTGDKYPIHGGIRRFVSSEVYSASLIVATALMLVLFSPNPALASSTDSLTLSLSSDKAVYPKGESVKLTIILENLSPRHVTVNKRMAYPGPDVMIEITDPRGEGLRWLPPAPPPNLTQADFTVLSSGQKLTLIISDLQSHLFDKLKQESEYRAKVRYQNTKSGAEFNHTAWTGSLESNTITFNWGG